MQPEFNSVDYEDLPRLDKYALYQLASVVDGIEDSYNKYQFYRFFQVSEFAEFFELGCSYRASVLVLLIISRNTLEDFDFY